MKNASNNTLSSIFGGLLWVALGTTLGTGEVRGMERLLLEETTKEVGLQSSSFGRLPNEIIIQTFSFLNFEERLTFGSTCKRLQEMSHASLKECDLKINTKSSMTQDEVVKIMTSSYARHIGGLDFSNPEPEDVVNPECLKILEWISPYLLAYPNIKRLDLSNNYLQEYDLEEENESFKRLITEGIFKHIFHLNLRNTYIDSETMNYFFSTIHLPHLSFLDLSHTVDLTKRPQGISPVKFFLIPSKDKDLLNSRLQKVDLTGVSGASATIKGLTSKESPSPIMLILEDEKDTNRRYPELKQQLTAAFPNLSLVTTLDDAKTKAGIPLYNNPYNNPYPVNNPFVPQLGIELYMSKFFAIGIKRYKP